MGRSGGAYTRRPVDIRGRNLCISRGQSRFSDRRSRDSGRSLSQHRVARIRNPLKSYHHRPASGGGRISPDPQGGSDGFGHDHGSRHRRFGNLPPDRGYRATAEGDHRQRLFAGRRSWFSAILVTSLLFGSLHICASINLAIAAVLTSWL